MLIHAAATLPLSSDSLVEALREFALFSQQHLSAGSDSEVSIAISESGAKCNRVLAGKLPPHTKGFNLKLLSRTPALTASEFLESTVSTKPDKTSSHVSTTISSAHDPFALIDTLAKVLPPTGRGIMLLLHLNGWKIHGDTSATVVDARFSRYSHGAHAISAGISLHFQALSLKDPSVALTVAQAAEQTGLRFRKVSAGFVANAKPTAIFPTTEQPVDPRLQPPSPEDQLNVLFSFDEAMARASDQFHARPDDLKDIPLLSGPWDAFQKRFGDVMAGKKESLNFPSHLKRFMRERLPSFRPDETDIVELWFRKSVAPTLDLLLTFEKIFQQGLGKTFTVEFAADFPNTPFGGMHKGREGTRKSIFWMFHQERNGPMWTYSTASELAIVLAGCGDLLDRILPPLEQHCRQLLLPPPAVLPPGIRQLGALSAHEAYDAALPMAREWADDALLQSICTSPVPGIRQPSSGFVSITEDGRLQPSGSWGLIFFSKKRHQRCCYVVPHTGRVWWSYFPAIEDSDYEYGTTLESGEWADSTVIAPRALQNIEQQLNGYRIEQVMLSLLNPNLRHRNPKAFPGPFGLDFLWEADCISVGEYQRDRRDIVVQLDPKTGEVLGSITR